MKSVAIAFVAIFGLAACKSDAEKLCLDGDSNAPSRMSACAELCEKGDTDACGMQAEIGVKRCLDADDAETCCWLCSHASEGKQTYCKHFEVITGTRIE